jgi:hypothetical protein
MYVIHLFVQADGLNAEARVGIPGDHRGILMDEHFFRVIKHWLKVGGADPEYDPETDYVMVPRRGFEFDSHMEESVAVAGPEGTEGDSLEAPPSQVYIATVETGKFFILFNIAHPFFPANQQNPFTS